METKILKQKDSNSHVYTFLAITFLITNVLFFLDEGYYDLRWMKSWGNWVVFSVYSLVIFSTMTIIFYFLRRWFNVKKSKLIALTLGTFVGLFLLLSVIFA